MAETKPVYTSKINIVQVITVGVGLASTWGLIPEANKVQVLESLVVVGPIATFILRTWFTGAPLTWSGDE